MTRLLLACLCLGAGQPVSAQTPPGWSITLTSARGEVGAATGGGTTIAPPTHFPIFSYLGATSVTYHLTGVGNGNGTGPGAKCSVTANDTLTLTVTGTWNGPGAAPSSVPILESSSANYWANGQTGGTLVADSQMASDGLGDPAVSTGLCSGVSRGKHLITVPVQGNTWTFDRTISAVSNCTDTMPVGAGAMAGGVGLGDYTVQIDNRSVAISCPSMDSPFANNLANNYYKGSQDILHGTDRYQHPRLPRGNSVDSVAYTLNDPLTGQQFVAAST